MGTQAKGGCVAMIVAAVAFAKGRKQPLSPAPDEVEVASAHQQPRRATRGTWWAN